MTVKCLGEKTSESFFIAADACLDRDKTFKTLLKDVLNGNIEADASNQEKENTIATILITSHIPFLEWLIFFWNYTLYRSVVTYI